MCTTKLADRIITVTIKNPVIKIFCGLCVEACPKDAIRMDTGVVSMAYTSRQTFDFTRDLLRDNYDPKVHSNPKYEDQDLPKPDNQSEALPHSQGIPAS